MENYYLQYYLPYYLPLIGGLLIGAAVSLMLVLNGRVTGVSGIIYGATVASTKGDKAWRWYFISGMLVGGFILPKKPVDTPWVL